MKKIILKDILEAQSAIAWETEKYPLYFTSTQKHYILNAIKDAIKQTLELASEEATQKTEGEFWISLGGENDTRHQVIDKQSILDIINQVE